MAMSIGHKVFKTFLLIVLLVVMSTVVSADINWRIYINRTRILSDATREGETLVFKSSACSWIPSNSGNLVARARPGRS